MIPRIRSVWPIMAAGILAVAGFVASVRAGDEAEETAVRKILNDQAAAWNRKDLDGFCVGYWNSPQLVFQSGGDRTEGFEAMKTRYKRRYQGEGKAMGTLTFKELDVTILGPDAAMVRGRWGLVMPDKKTPNGLFTLILRKFPEGWRIVHDHTSSAA